MSDQSQSVPNTTTGIKTAEQITLARLDGQLAWYDRRSRGNRTVYKCLKSSTLAAAVLIPGLTIFGIHRAAEWAAALGILISLFEGVQQLNQCYANWLSYRSTAEALAREKFYYLGAAGPYTNVQNPQTLLAERVETLITQENSKWLTSQSHSTARESG